MVVSTRISGLGTSGTRFGNMPRRYLECDSARRDPLQGLNEPEGDDEQWHVVILCVSGLCRLPELQRLSTHHGH